MLQHMSRRKPNQKKPDNISEYEEEIIATRPFWSRQGARWAGPLQGLWWREVTKQANSMEQMNWNWNLLTFKYRNKNNNINYSTRSSSAHVCYHPLHRLQLQLQLNLWIFVVLLVAIVSRLSPTWQICKSSVFKFSVFSLQIQILSPFRGKQWPLK